MKLMNGSRYLICVSIFCPPALFFFFLDRSYLSLDWEPETKKKYFDETVVEVTNACACVTLQS